MASSGMLRRVALVRTDVSVERSASFIRVTRIGELGTKLAVTSNLRTLRRNTKIFLVTLMKEALSSSETSILTRATPRNIPEDKILHSHRPENLKSYIGNTMFRKMDVSILRSGVIPTSLDLLEGTNLNCWTRDPTESVSPSSHLKTETDPVFEVFTQYCRKGYGVLVP
jgi:hypothetical protein